MSLQFNTSTYKEEFRSPGRGKQTRPRPSSAHRRNNPHPRPDFLLPRRLQTGHGARQTFPAQTSLDYSTRFFPPVRHISVQCQAEGSPASVLQRPNPMEKQAAHRLAVSSARAHLLPSSGQLCKPQTFDSPLRERQFQNTPKNSQGKMEPLKSMEQGNSHLSGSQCYPHDLQPHIIQGSRRISGNELLKETASKYPDHSAALRYPKPQAYFRKSRSDTSLDPSGVYSCFQVVKPYKAGYYIIHPEFVSESLT